MKAGRARVNLVLSGTGLGLAKALKEMFGTPYVIGVPYGETYQKLLFNQLKAAAEQGSISETEEKDFTNKPMVAVVGEGVTSLSLARAIELETGFNTRVICVTECEKQILRKTDCLASCEEDAENGLKGVDMMIADPLYKPICPEHVRFHALPTEAFSGRIYRREIPNLVEHFDHFVKELIS